MHFLRPIMEPAFNPVLLIFARDPSSGTPKSRIAKTEGSQRAREIYRELIAITAETVSDFCHYVAFTGDATSGELSTIFPSAKGFFPQTTGALGIRLRNAVDHLFEMNYSHVCCIGCDCPTLSRQDIRTAYCHLSGDADAVIGPALDGGYYLIGVAANAMCVFDAESFETSSLYTETRALLNQQGLPCALLSEKSDIDTFKDYTNWKVGQI
jgi:rSAM/selenodomain-associated transferase 1